MKVTRTDLHRCYSPISFTVIRTWVEGGGCKAHACGWDYIVTLYNPKTHKVVGYYYNIDPGYLIWFGETGVHEFAYLVRDYVNKTN
ncbi:DNA polymerase III subunit gamma/tau [Shigella flexneri]|uniref:hypothetical protein n=1 Tax=Shigella TaxID=620 RepID=UPI00069A4C8A|nr:MULTISPECIES: hypothetical protein [Shigella]MDO8247878.1 DNA polymerase III subunit gamma/tau [Shigella flexneri]